MLLEYWIQRPQNPINRLLAQIFSTPSLIMQPPWGGIDMYRGIIITRVISRHRNLLNWKFWVSKDYGSREKHLLIEMGVKGRWPDPYVLSKWTEFGCYFRKMNPRKRNRECFTFYRSNLLTSNEGCLGKSQYFSVKFCPHCS